MKWTLRKRKRFQPYVDSVIAKYKTIGIGSIMAQVLCNRNVDFEEVKKLITKPETCLEEPTAIHGCKKVSKAIISLVQSNVPIVVFADYDVDGLTAGYIMTNYLQRIGAKAEVYYPERSEGYGLSLSFVNGLEEGKAIVTVDNGTSAIAAAQRCVERNIPLIITDHHEPKNVLPDVPICNPWVGDEHVGQHLCGAAVAWKICQCIDDILGVDYSYLYTPYVAIGTVADVMPMTLENMAIVNVGLAMLQEGYAPNLVTFFKAMGVSIPTSDDVAWKLGPQLNSCGRMGNVKLAKELLFYQGNKKGLTDIILKIDNLDKTRKAITKEAMVNADKQDFSNEVFCLFDATEYPSGISGIIANKLVEAYNKPAIVYSRNQSSVWSGSLRSNGFNVLPYLEQEKRDRHIFDYGGHASACGVSLLSDIKTFKQSFSDRIRQPLQNFKGEEKTGLIDLEISLSDVTKKLYVDIMKLPSDKSTFPKVIFIVRNLKVTGTRLSSGNKNNICFTLVDDSKVLHNLWAWNKATLYDKLGKPQYIDIVGSIGMGFGNDAGNAVFNVEDILCS